MKTLRRGITRIGIATLAGLLAWPIAARAQGPADGVELRYRFEPGQVLRFDVQQDVDIETTIQDTTQTADNRSLTTKRWEVTAVDAQGLATVRLTLERVRLEARLSGVPEPIIFDSADPELQASEFEDIMAVVGEPTAELEVSPYGDRVGAVRSLTEEATVQVEGMPLLAIPLPPGPVQIGDSWRYPRDPDEYLELRVPDPEVRGAEQVFETQQTFRLVAVEDGIAQIRFRTDVRQPVTDPKIEVQLVQRLPQGTVLFDIARGVIVEQRMEIDRRVVGFAGPVSSMQIVSRYVETLRPTGAERAAMRDE